MHILYRKGRLEIYHLMFNLWVSIYMTCDRQAGVISLLNLSMPLEREGMKYVKSNSLLFVADFIKSILFNYLFPHIN